MPTMTITAECSHTVNHADSIEAVFVLKGQSMQHDDGRAEGRSLNGDMTLLMAVPPSEAYFKPGERYQLQIEQVAIPSTPQEV